MANIKEIKARQILDSRGHPTIECDIILSDNFFELELELELEELLELECVSLLFIFISNLDSNLAKISHSSS